MIAILTFDGDGNESIIAIVSDKTFVSQFIKKHTGFKDKGFIKYSSKEYQEYWCIEFNKDKEGIILYTNE